MGKIIARVRERESAAAAVRLREWNAEDERQRLNSMIDRHAAYLESMRVRVTQEDLPKKPWWVWPK